MPGASPGAVSPETGPCLGGPTTMIRPGKATHSCHGSGYHRKVLIEAVADRLATIIREVCQEHQAEVLSLDVQSGHVHLLVECDPQFGIHRLVKLIKGRSSRFLRQEFPRLKTRVPTLWTNSYFVSTVGGAPLRVMNQYIGNQKHV